MSTADAGTARRPCCWRLRTSRRRGGASSASCADATGPTTRWSARTPPRPRSGRWSASGPRAGRWPFGLADQWLPEMTGIELLIRLHGLHPTAKRALAVAWGDRLVGDAMFRAVTLGQITTGARNHGGPATSGSTS